MPVLSYECLRCAVDAKAKVVWKEVAKLNKSRKKKSRNFPCAMVLVFICGFGLGFSFPPRNTGFSLLLGKGNCREFGGLTPLWETAFKVLLDIKLFTSGIG